VAGQKQTQSNPIFGFLEGGQGGTCVAGRKKRALKERFRVAVAELGEPVRDDYAEALTLEFK